LSWRSRQDGKRVPRALYFWQLNERREQGVPLAIHEATPHMRKLLIPAFAFSRSQWRPPRSPGVRSTMPPTARPPAGIVWTSSPTLPPATIAGSGTRGFRRTPTTASRRESRAIIRPDAGSATKRHSHQREKRGRPRRHRTRTLAGFRKRRAARLRPAKARTAWRRISGACAARHRSNRGLALERRLL
jgi:hypothetical protein